MARRFRPGMRSAWRLMIVGAFAWAILGIVGEYSAVWPATLTPLVLLFVAFVWPTEWRYHQHNGYLLRQHRIDGTIETFTKDGWIMIEAPTEEAVTGHIPTQRHG